MVIVALIFWPHRREPFDARRWKAHEGREAMVHDVQRMIRPDAIYDESTAEAHLGKPDRRERNSRDERAWWYDLDTRGRRYLRLDFNSTGRLASHRTGPPSDDD